MRDFFECDQPKAVRNFRSHRVAFQRICALDWNLAIEARDLRHMEEVRTIVLAPIRNRLHVAVITRRGEKVRIISLRKANEREVRRYVRFFE